MIWGYPKSKGGIVNRKTIRLKLCALFKRLFGSYTNYVQVSEMVTIMTDRDKHLTVIGNSNY